MAFDTPFSDPIITMKRDNATVPYISITEEVYVNQGSALLTEIPYKANRVKILEQTGGTSNVNILDGGSFTDSNSSGTQTIINPNFFEIDSGDVGVNQYKVDYIQGVITFNSAQEGAKFLVNFVGTGFHYFPSSRISYKQNIDGTVTTLKQVLDSSVDTINNIKTAENNANTAANNATNATANFQSLLDQQLVIYLQSVATYADIATTYPNPQLGWTVTEKQYGVRYRFDGTAWKEIGISQAGDGFNVYIGESAPANTNILWLEVPNANRMTRIVKSTTAPADTTVIWWEI